MRGQKGNGNDTAGRGKLEACQLLLKTVVSKHVEGRVKRLRGETGGWRVKKKGT